MKNLLTTVCALATALCSYAQQFNINVVTPDTTNLALYIQSEGPSDDGNLQLQYVGTAYSGECPKASNNFYNLTCMKNGGQFNIPLYLTADNATISIEFADGIPTNIQFAPAPKDKKAKKAAKPSAADVANLAAVNEYFGKSCEVLRHFWMNMRNMNPQTTSDAVSSLRSLSTDINLRSGISADVKHYIDIWSYLDGYNMIDGYNRTHEDNIAGANLLLLTPPEVLNNKIAMMHHSAIQVAYINVPKKDLPTRIKYVRDNYTVPEVQKAIETSVLDNYLRYYKFENGTDRGMKELTEAQQQYGIDNKYIEQFKEKMSTISGAPFPADVILETEDGTRVDFAQFRGKYVYVDLWASWCVPCVREVPHLKALEHSLENDKVVFVSISCDTDRAAWLKKKEALALHGNQFINADNKLCEKLNVNGIPRFLIYDPNGNLLNPNATRPSNKETKATLEGLK